MCPRPMAGIPRPAGIAGIIPRPPLTSPTPPALVSPAPRPIAAAGAADTAGLGEAGDDAGKTIPRPATNKYISEAKKKLKSYYTLYQTQAYHTLKKT